MSEEKKALIKSVRKMAALIDAARRLNEGKRRPRPTKKEK